MDLQNTQTVPFVTPQHYEDSTNQVTASNNTSQTGIVVVSIDEMLQVIGLDDAKMSELLVCNSDVFSVVMGLETTLTNVMLYAAAQDVEESDLVIRTFDELLIETGFDVLSTVLDPLGNVISVL